jgi:recombination protein RecT
MSESTIATVPDKPNVDQLLAKMSDKKLKLGDRINTIGEIMKATSGRMLAALPKHVTPDRMIKVALNAIRRNPKLLECSAPSLFGAITEAATYGWEIGGILGHAYLVPFRNECQLIPGYKGLIDLCRRSGQVSTISMEVVHKGDEFSYSLGDDPHIHHRPNDKDTQRDKKPIIYVYAVVRLRDGGVQRSVWSTERVDAHKEQYSKAWQWAETGDSNRGGGKKDSFWHTNWAAAAKKTVIRDMINRGLIPVSAEYRDVVDRGLHQDADELEFATFDMVPNGEGEGDAFGIGGDTAIEAPEQSAQQPHQQVTPKAPESPQQSKTQNGSIAQSAPTQANPRPATQPSTKSRSMTAPACREYITMRWEEESSEFDVDRLAGVAATDPNPMAFIDFVISKSYSQFSMYLNRQPGEKQPGELSQEPVNDGPAAEDVGQDDLDESLDAGLPACIRNAAARPKKLSLTAEDLEKMVIGKRSPEMIRKYAKEEITNHPALDQAESEYLRDLAERRAWQLEHNIPTTDRLPR